MENKFEQYSKKLDLEVEKLPTIKSYLELIECSRKKGETPPHITDFVGGFIKNLKKILEYLNAKEVIIIPGMMKSLVSASNQLEVLILD